MRLHIPLDAPGTHPNVSRCNPGASLSFLKCLFSGRIVFGRSFGRSSASLIARMFLLRIVAKLHGDVVEAENNIRRWGRGSVWIDPSSGTVQGAGIRLSEGVSECRTQ